MILRPRTRPWPLAAILLLAPLALAPAAAAGRPDAGEPPRETYGDEITVALDSLTVRVLDPAGRPILGLTPANFQILVHGQEVPVTAVDWVSSEPQGTADLEALPEGDAGPTVASAPPQTQAGKLVVLFVQTDLNPSRISGQLRLRRYTREVLGTLAPADQVAVVSFDSHLKLWLDFTGDRDATWAALDRAMLYSPEVEVAPSFPLSLAAHFDRALAQDTASPEKALEVTGRALGALPGEKTMIFLGWGLGRFGGGGVHMTPSFPGAVRALLRARTSVFVLDITSADSHDLEAGLQLIAAATGGTYEKTFRLPALATARLAHTISGWYVVAFDRDALGGLPSGEAEVRLRGRRGEVLARPVVLRR